MKDQLGNGALPRRPHTRKDQDIGCKEIAKFLSQDGEMISHSKVGRILNIAERLAPELQAKAERSVNQWDTSGNKLSISKLEILTQFPKDEQRDLAKQIEQSDEGHKQLRDHIKKYNKSDDQTKQLVRSGALKLDQLKEPTIEGIVPKTANEDVKDFKERFYSSSRNWQDLIIQLRTIEILSDYHDIELKHFKETIEEIQGDELLTHKKLEEKIQKEVMKE